MADHSTEIAALEAIVNSATKSVSVDGTSTSFDLQAARKRLAELYALDDAAIAEGRMVRPHVFRVKLGGRVVNSFFVDTEQQRVASLGYDAAEDTGRRRIPAVRVRHEDEEATARKREQLSATGWDSLRNFTIAAWAIRKHLDFVSSFRFQAKTDDRAYNAELEAFVENMQQRQKFDVSRRHPYRRAVRLAEACRCVDGDVFWLRLTGPTTRGTIQAIEGSRIGIPRSEVRKLKDPDSWCNGVLVGTDGSAKKYAISERSKTGALTELSRIVPASRMMAHSFFMRFDQVRGVSPVAAGLNWFRDTYEGFEYALAKTKVAQLFGLSFYRDGGADGGPFGSGTAVPTKDTDEDLQADANYGVELGKGPFVVDLDPGDRAEFLEAKTPATETVNFLKLMVHVAIKSLDIPYSFFDESHTNFYGSRGGLIQYLKSCKEKIADLQDFQNAWARWRLGLAVADGELELPAGKSFDWLKWQFVPAGVPWWDPVKEVQGAAMSVAAGFSSPQRVCREIGTDFEENIAEIAMAMQIAEQAGVPLTFASGTAFNPAIEVSNPDA